MINTINLIILRNLALLPISLLVVICSCSKGNSPAPAPVPQKPDTSYLAKTEVLYSYDATGNNIEDSSIYKWTYDAQGRTTTYTVYFTDQKDSMTYSYSSGQNITTSLVYASFGISVQDKRIDYFSAPGHIDSSADAGYNVTISNGIASNQPFSNIKYFYYDGNGNVVTDSSYNLLSAKTFAGGARLTYSNNSLTSLTEFVPNGNRTSVAYYQAGNVVSDTIFDNSANILLIHAYTYLPTLSGEFINYGGGSANLLATFMQTDPLSSSDSFSQTISYTFDSVNRVSTVTRKFSSGITSQKQIFTYY